MMPKYIRHVGQINALVHEYEDDSNQRRGRLSLDDYVSNKEQEKRRRKAKRKIN